VGEAGVVLDHAPGLVDAVLDGTLALDAAYRSCQGSADRVGR